MSGNNEKSASLNETVYEELKKQISSGRYRPGQRLVTKDIAADFDVSRTPVIVAVNRLAAEGLATAIPQQGVFVKKFSVKELYDILIIRRMIELYSIGPVMKTMMFDRNAAEDLRAAADELSELNPNDYVKAYEMENRFHSILISMTENAELVKIFEAEHCLDVSRQVYQIANMGIADIELGRIEHGQLVDLLEQGREEDARKLMETHMSRPIDLLNWLITTGRLG